MRQLRSHRMLGSAAVLGAALIALGACSKKADQTTIQSGGNVATAAFQVADVQLGRSVGADKRVANATDTFAPADTIYASVHTTGTAQNATVAAHWTYQDGQTVNDQTETISPTGDAYTEFHISKPSGWPAGKYTLHVMVNGQEVQTKDFTVNK
ncbi:MAG TPA: hypothetical protein VFJ20_03225 [Gemmatimonadaceae bacterium]|nr:hypothetical protein [Gemmatimonadaceae bacterium]